MKRASLYIHIPFCSRKCLFCSFVVAVGQEHRRDDYVAALIKEMKSYRGFSIGTIYLGGGTPSMLEERQLETLMQEMRNNFSVEDHAEVTLEANPESIDPAKARFLKKIGFNRISMGVQSMNERYLKYLGRRHSAGMAKDAFAILRQAGFSNINLDLMYAFPGQTQEELEEDVHAIARQESEHLSLYTLTIEPNSRFHAAQMKLDDDEKLAGHYLLIEKILAEYGLKQYEVSNFARPGFESAHNKNYWLGGAYVGLGVGAHGFLENRRYWNTPHLQQYLHTDQLVEGYEDLSEETLTAEKLVFGLRMNQGIFLKDVAASKYNDIQPLLADGFLVVEDGFLKATAKGRLVLDELSSRLI